MVKKLLAGMLALTMVFGLSACGNSDSSADTESITQSVETSETEIESAPSENNSVSEEADGASAADSGPEESIAEAAEETPLIDPTYVSNFSDSPYKFYVPGDFEQVLSYEKQWYSCKDEDIDDDIFYSLGSLTESESRRFEEFFAEDEAFAEYGFDINNVYDIPEILFTDAPFYFDDQTMLKQAERNEKLWKGYKEYKEANGTDPYLDRYKSTFDVETDEETTLLGFPALHRTGIINLNHRGESIVQLYFEAYYLVAPLKSRQSILECVIYSENQTDEAKAKIAEYMSEVVANSYVSEEE